jgi:DNA-binding CsgD family transcriptional regulator
VALYDGLLQHTPTQPPETRAARLEAYAQSLAAIDQQPQAIDALKEAHGLYRAAGEVRKAGACLGALALPYSRSGQNAEAELTCRTAIAELEPLGDTAELASVLRIRAHLCMLDRETGQALHFGRRAIGMAGAVDDQATLAAAHMTVGTALLVADDLRGRRHIDHAVHLARTLGRPDLESIVQVNAGSAYGEQYRFADAEPFLVEGVALAEAHDLDQNAWYLRAWLALVRLGQGRLEEAITQAREVVDAPAVSAVSRMMALVALGRATTRLGGDGAPFLEEALAQAELTGTLQRLAPVRLARAEAAWLRGDLATCLSEAEAVWSLAVRHRHQWMGGEMFYWRHVCGAPPEAPAWIAAPYALQAQGRWREAAEAWAELECPFEQARALAEGDVEGQQAALRIYDDLGAAPAAAALRRALRQSGVRQVPRGPRGPARENTWGLTGRQQEIAALLAEGLSNKHISRALRISPKTVETHVSAILAKLEVATRQDARERLSTPSAP